MNDFANCIIVEDEIVHSNRLRKLLSVTDERVRVLSVCRTQEDALARIHREHPQLLFLDIRLQDNARGGFDLLQKIERPAFDVIFTTAHIDGNINEIRRCGIDYLPKPYIQSELQDALNKFWERGIGHIGIGHLNTLLHNLVTDQLDEQMIWLKLAEGSIPVKIKSLIYCKARNQYTDMYVFDENSGKITEIRTSTGLGVWEKDLAGVRFCRTHDSYLVNIRHIAKVGASSLHLKHIKDPLNVSPTGKERLNAIMKMPLRRG